MEEFSNDYVLINDNGIDLLRNQFPYRHINFSEIHSTRILSSYLLQNRLIPLIFGILFIAISSKLMSPEFEILKEIPNSTAHLYGRGLAGISGLLFIPIVLFGLGAYFIVQSLKKSKILLIVTESCSYHIRIKEFEKGGKIQDLIVFLDNRLLRNVENAI